MVNNSTTYTLKQLTAILIDDESNSRNSLRQKLITYCPNVEIAAEAENGEEGIKVIEVYKPDIVFLDVEMPRMNGFNMLQQLKHRSFELIFTTAYDHYAIQAIRFSALDYLVKPIEIPALKEAVERALEKKQTNAPNKRIETLLYNLLDEKNIHNRLAIPSMEGLQFVEIADIIYLEAESNYTFIHLQPASRITVSKTLKDFEELLPGHVFIRIHHSFIINKNHIRKYLKGDGGQVLMSNGKILDVARRKKEEFLKAIGY
jgi:two-component system LytT family response regulator